MPTMGGPHSAGGEGWAAAMAGRMMVAGCIFLSLMAPRLGAGPLIRTFECVPGGLSYESNGPVDESCQRAGYLLSPRPFLLIIFDLLLLHVPEGFVSLCLTSLLLTKGTKANCLFPRSLKITSRTAPMMHGFPGIGAHVSSLASSLCLRHS